MPRYRLTLEYDGTPFAGWQRQENGPSVQAVLEVAGERLSGQRAPVAAAGRTDSGVHALGMEAHIDLDRAMPADTVRDALNFHLRPHPVAVLEASLAEEGFHARFSCIRRHYRYRFVERRAPLSLDRDRVWRRPFILDVEAMNAAALLLKGKHDFTTFRSANCQADSPVKTLEDIAVTRVGGEVHLTCHARSFLHNQVRSFAGTLERVGAGKWSAEDVASALAAADRTACGPVAPACGLYFVKADY
ncbi:tRNA pseudouridine(38-40) synthase TruA [Aquisalinus flavus]|uniref:tRNA pseudouridine synthase A n=1 Tax=Aquisalinus flavus TaxID=1526572 RepID=A0A8J2V313_9PROT|nr:tRNA pseudouridine(38-40) synthase TruA [Aquisalinus flavus]MBD0425298.1 tRNA pseudouridine(38-40) synthase TruA [Aquisalinus flavus]UNE49049.1 tRNA pseudouridine(38-40) synthase TruA [Aquisalinus flavus]GGD17182.1 tRNA pseudouridine synthase A [Aquisalinus flavus]